MSDFSWLDEKKLDGFENDVVHVLAQNPFMDERRISIISHHVKERVREVLERKQELGQKPLDDLIKSCSEKIENQRAAYVDDVVKQEQQKGAEPKR